MIEGVTVVQILDRAPDGWTPERVDAFNVLVSACLGYMVYDYALGKLNVVDPVLLQRRTDLGQLITGQLGPAFRAS